MEVENKIVASLPKFKDEDALYFKPTTLEEWENTWDFGSFDANVFNHAESVCQQILCCKSNM